MFQILYLLRWTLPLQQLPVADEPFVFCTLFTRVAANRLSV